MARTFQFQSGRSDCVQVPGVSDCYAYFMTAPQRDAEFGYKATKMEHHPSHVANGRSTIEFFRESFEMSGREVVALMGAHTFGELIF